jgi:hypothetical protein
VVLKEIKRMDRPTVKCQVERCEQVATLVFVAAGVSGARWVYREMHAAARAEQEGLKLPGALALSVGV